ncbi:hypothetical protein ACIRVF_04890 [Kitasatospora sp. NPDC101157]|uniref:hypothetical protein n=1 Tax=Kitasatospora sp. NPDC101157 TaxID=3364098 RepID=UPI003816F737
MTKNGKGRRKAVRVGMITAAAGAMVLGTVGYDAAATLAEALPRAWSGTPYPVADPAAVARHLDTRAQAVYDALALPPGATLTSGSEGDGITARSYGACRARGLTHLLESMGDTGADQPRTAALGARFTLAGVGRPQWQQARQRARQALTDQGWTVAAVDGSAAAPGLTLTPPATGPGSLVESVSISFDPVAGTLAVAAATECAHYPDSTPTGPLGEPTDLPAITAPTQLRNR